MEANSDLETPVKTMKSPKTKSAIYHLRNIN